MKSVLKWKRNNLAKFVQEFYNIAMEDVVYEEVFSRI